MPIKQSGDLALTPYQQAKRYAGGLRFENAARWIATCNFREFRVHDLNSDKPSEPVGIVQLEELPGHYHVLDFLADAQQVRVAREKEVSVEAGRHISRIYHALLAKCPAPDDTRLLHGPEQVLRAAGVLPVCGGCGIVCPRSVLAVRKPGRQTVR